MGNKLIIIFLTKKSRIAFFLLNVFFLFRFFFSRFASVSSLRAHSFHELWTWTFGLFGLDWVPTMDTRFAHGHVSEKNYLEPWTTDV